MFKNTLLAVSASLLLCFLPCCKKKENNTPAPGFTADSLFNELSLKPKVLTVDAATGGTFYGNSGTRYYFYPNSFMLASGAAVTGAINIEVTEYLLNGDMLFSKMLPVSNNEPLISGGEINVVATQNGAPVFLKPGSIFSAAIPPTGNTPAGMKLFTGQATADTSVIKTNWIQAQRDSAQNMANVFQIPGAIIGRDTMQIISDSLKLCNADQFLTLPNYQSFTIAVTVSGHTLATEAVYGYALYDLYKGVWPLYHYSTSDKKFTEGHIPSIPVHFVAFTVIDGKFYGGILAGTPLTGATYNIELTQWDPETYKTMLNKL